MGGAKWIKKVYIIPVSKMNKKNVIIPVYNVVDFYQAITNLAQTNLRNINR